MFVHCSGTCSFSTRTAAIVSIQLVTPDSHSYTCLLHVTRVTRVCRTSLMSAAAPANQITGKLVWLMGGLEGETGEVVPGPAVAANPVGGGAGRGGGGSSRHA